MSTINTNAIDGNYPVPGQNNSSQGFRTNFQSIIQNLNIASDEITDLQNNAVLKAPLANTVLNNDMANALISNCSTLAFRATTYNLGNALVGTVVVDVSLGDVQYGNVAGNVTFQFGGWAPTLTSQTITLQLGMANAANTPAVITWPAEVVALSDDYGVTMLENYKFVSNVSTVTAPSNVTQLNYRLTSIDCGNSIYIEPINRPFQAAQIVQRTPPSTGEPGDTVGTVCIDTGTSQLVISNAFSTTTLSNVSLIGSLSNVIILSTSGQFSCNTTAFPLSVGQPVTISGVAGGTGSIVGYSDPTVYYIISTDGFSIFTLSTTPGGSAITTTMGTLTGLTFNAGGILSFASSALPLYANQTITLSGTLGGTGTITGYSNPTTYFIKSTNGDNYAVLSSTLGGNAITTTSGTLTGLTYTVDVNYFGTSNTSTLYSGMPVIITGISLEPNVVVGNTYFINNVVSNTAFTLSSTSGGANIDIATNGNGSTMKLNPVQYMYVAVQDFDANVVSNVNVISTTAPNLIVISNNVSSANVANNYPIKFTGDSANLANVGLDDSQIYYIKNWLPGSFTLTVSKTRSNGVAGIEYQGVQTVVSNPGVDPIIFNGIDIFRRIPLQPF